MADKMEFPSTIEEFIKGYSFKNIDEVYTNGAELIPVFRVEQAFEHYEKEIREKAIDEFAEVVEINIIDMFVSESESGMAVGILKAIAEQMKGGTNGKI